MNRIMGSWPLTLHTMGARPLLQVFCRKSVLGVSAGPHPASSASTATSCNAQQGRLPRTMGAWVASTSLDGSVHLEQGLDLPFLRNPNSILVKVKAASLNPLDLMMTKGYGKVALEMYARLFPEGQGYYGQATSAFDSGRLVPGRDFSGEVVDLGSVWGDPEARRMEPLRLGDQVWGTVYPAYQGTLAEYVVVPRGSDLKPVLRGCGPQVCRKPENLSHVEAASVPFAGLTAWSGMVTTGGVKPCSSAYLPQKVLILGATGGVGTLAVQLAKAFHCKVVATCKDDAFEMVSALGADVVLDYQSAEFESQLKNLKGQFDLILDCSGQKDFPSGQYLRKGSSKFVTFTTPVLTSTDTVGLAAGTFFSLVDLAARNVASCNSYRWAYFEPNQVALKTMGNLAKKGQIKPVIQNVYKFSDVPAAFEELRQGGARGKVVVDLEAN